MKELGFVQEPEFESAMLARAWFLEITLVRTSVCVFVYVCVSAPQVMKNYTREMKPE